MLKTQNLGFLILFAFTALLGQQAAADDSPILDRILQTGVVRIGYSADDAPFSFLDASGKPIGYSIDLCSRVVDGLRLKYHRPDLKVQYEPRSAANRFAKVMDGTIDIECVSTTNTAERRKSVAFSYAHFLTATQFVSLKANDLHRIEDLAGRTVTSPVATNTIGYLNSINRSRNLNIAVVPSSDQPTAFAMVTEGRASAYVMDSILLAVTVANSGTPEKYSLSDDSLMDPEPYGLMFRKGDERFKADVNAVLRRIFQGDEIKATYDRWFMSPIPPNGINLNLPMSAALRKILQEPTDQ
ncbi:amino acid ABC transporter substrate-binding protein [Agrobacterium vitis]|uniref:amino acid ABC transporter substrate-binding protein n=1 Tax=Allorhizobium ampelinum TaxID=3025782 RepID=UPI001F2FBCC6|nr:amino acid ABC transporter substrate-binding protein [Allorhizobium ampelinum]MCF1449843.1 amino acid ABC transporter substrate-binding protein [Allorhizobium ampelinum]